MVRVSSGSSDLGSLRVSALALLLEQGPAAPALTGLENGLASAINRVLTRRDFRASRDEVLHLLGADDGVERVLLVGMGKVTDRLASLKRAAAVAARRAGQAGV